MSSFLAQESSASRRRCICRREGRAVTLVDRLGAAATETSFGNTGIVQSEAVFPYMFPARAASRSPPPRSISIRACRSATRAAFDRAVGLALFPRLLAEPAAGGGDGDARAGRALRRRASRARRGRRRRARCCAKAGWIKVYRTTRGEDIALEDIEETKPFGIAERDAEPRATARARAASRARSSRRRPFHRSADDARPAGAGGRPTPTCSSRAAASSSPATRDLAQSGDGWTLTTADGPLQASRAVVALGPWTSDLAGGVRLSLPARRQARLPHALRRQGERRVLNRPVLDLERGYVLTPMARGVRLTTGAEFARRDDPPSSAHLDRLEPYGREMFPLAERLDPPPWLGERPCLPDMAPVIGPAPRHKGLWFDFGHQHLGLTLGPGQRPAARADDGGRERRSSIRSRSAADRF